MATAGYQSGRYTFGANDHPNGQAFITLEPEGKGLPVLGKGILFLKLRDGANIKHAEELARQLNELVEAVEYAP